MESKKITKWESYDSMMERMEKKRRVRVAYKEPDDYFPEEIRKQYKLGEYAEPEALLKIKAVILGSAVGDALGVPVEFCTRESLSARPVTDMRGFGSYPLPKGCWSDDTSLSLAALDNLADGELDYFDIMVNFAKWLKKGEYTPMGIRFDVGRTCKRTIQHFFDLCYTEENGFLLPPGLDLAWIGETEEASNGNGSLMRIHPFVLMAYYDKHTHHPLEETVDRASSLTHAHERSLLACRIYARVLWGLLENPDKATVFAILKEVAEEYRNHPESIHFRRILDGTLPTLKSEAIRSHGYVVDTLEAALWCLLTTESYHDCVLKAVNLGHDTDTVAAVAGGLAGALYGYRNIPTGWLENLKRREYIESMCERAYTAWQG